MTTTGVYRIPDLDVYFDGNGRFVSRDDIAGSVTDLTAANSRILDRVYLGGQLVDGTNNYRVMSGGVAAFFAVLGAILELIEAVERIVEAVEYIEGPKPDPVLAALAAIHAQLGLIEDASLAAWASTREDNLTVLRAYSSTALSIALEFHESKESRTDPVWASKIATADRDSLFVVNAFVHDIDHGFWMRPNSAKAMKWAGPADDVDHGWMPHIADRAGQDALGRVWDHRWALPVCAYAIAARISVLLLVKDSRSKLRKEAAKYNGFLSGVFKRMEAGVRHSQAPSFETWNQSWGHRAQIPIAAADIHGGDYIGGVSWHPFFAKHYEFPGPFPSGFDKYMGGYTYDSFVFWHDLLARYWRNIVCQRIGLPELLMLCGKLENLVKGDDLDPKVIFANIHKKLVLRGIEDDPRAVRAHATGYLVSRSPDYPESSATKAHLIYTALRSDDRRVDELSATYLKQLQTIGEELDREDSEGAKTSTEIGAR
ncbi:hypothetical protein AXA44_01290 [Rhodococcus sp. SC4]|nr:hypothetical protein AXA44_01290 [Rhodococcus sp. SC4]